MKYFDIHSHVQFPDFDDDREDVIARMKKDCVSAIVVGIDLESSRRALELAEKHDNLFACVGLHPNESVRQDFGEAEFEKLMEHEKVVAVGECGLDYFRTEETDENKKKQMSALERQIDFAVTHGKPLMLHIRDAYGDALDILESKKKEYDDKLRGNAHFFAGDVDVARRLLDIGFTMSFTGVITFARNYDEVIQYVSLENIMSETDCPYVAPVPYRGSRNEPSYVVEVVKKIAEICGEDEEKTANTLYKNAQKYV